MLQSPPTSRLWLLPLIGGTTWFLTLLILLTYWLAEGRPIYPLQTNPYIAFISDIGAHRLKPLFIIGGTLTALAYIATIAAVHHAYHSPRVYDLAADPEDNKTRAKRTASAIAILAALVAGLSCILMTGFDTYRYHERHTTLLTCTFVGIAVSAIATSVVYLRETIRVGRVEGLHRVCVGNAVVVLMEVALTFALMGTLYSQHQRAAGILEWIISFVGAAYVWSFVGILWVSGREKDASGERQPLLQGGTIE